MKVSNLHFSYGKSNKLVLNDVSFTLAENKLNVLIGMNGAGKTTLLDCITGNLKPLSGELSLPPVSEILYLTQNVFFSRALKGSDFVIFVRELSGAKASNQVEDYLGDMDEKEQALFRHLWATKIGQYSVGEWKYLYFTSLFKIDRGLYILDEITSGIDPISRNKIMESLKKKISTGKTCLLSTHQLQDLHHIDTHLILLHDGEVKYEGDFLDWLNQYDTTNPDVAFNNCIYNQKRTVLSPEI